MSVFEISTVWMGAHSAAAWFDDAACLWRDERLARPDSLMDVWSAPRLKLHDPERVPTPVLFNPDAFAVDHEIRHQLEEFDELEFLPVEIEGFGTYFILHFVIGIDLPAGARALRPSPPANGNVVRVDGFPADFNPAVDFFRIRQPADSPAGRAGASTRSRYASERGAAALLRVAGSYFDAKPVPKH